MLMPVVFVGHGSPMNAGQDNDFTKALSDFAGKIPKTESDPLRLGALGD